MDTVDIISFVLVGAVALLFIFMIYNLIFGPGPRR